MTTDATIEIRPYRDSDLDEVIERVRELQRHEGSYEPRMKKPEAIGLWYIEHLLKDCAEHKGEIFVADAGGAVIGYACVFSHIICDDPDEEAYPYAYIADLAVAPSHRGRGLGRRLISTCETFARNNGADCLRIGVLADNDGARRLYETVGFRSRALELEMALKA
jgi:ribosomal protein S18 acetylase RimI-like enzyme